MVKPLYSNIRNLLETGQDFAYFCRFNDQDRVNGEEFLFETDSRPLEFNGNGREVLNTKLPRLLDASSSEKEPFIPVFVSYDFIEDVFQLNSTKRAGWPMIGAIDPDITRKGRVVREQISGFSGSGEARIEPNEREKLEESIAAVVDRIRNGELLQTVLSNRFDVEPFDGPSLLQYLIENDRSRYVYYFRMGEKEIVGSSPENVFVRDGKEIFIHPIAGTRRRGVDNDSYLVDSLMNDSKELCEHRMLVDLARNDLSRISVPGSVRVAVNMVPEHFHSVIHLTSRVEGALPDSVTNYDIFSSIFPAGTVSGAPKRRALELINEYEKTPRGPYAGAIGLLGRDQIEMALTIRSAYKNRNESYIQAGAGIVKDSVARREVDEMIAKANTLMAGGLVCE